MSEENINDKITEIINKDDVVLFMKGTPVFPQCGFSSTVVDVLSHVGAPFQSYNILEDEALREGIKTFSNWPTIPQLYVKGEFVGGCDIIREMYSEGELSDLLKDKGIATEA
ncbi:MAG: Grx4 family monothiol glutaredoxin [Sphingomonadales bacterium]|nr:Grx4 family monothiol glutaredoxin [Sphingomonadales bacterium]